MERLTRNALVCALVGASAFAVFNTGPPALNAVKHAHGFDMVAAWEQHKTIG